MIGAAFAGEIRDAMMLYAMMAAPPLLAALVVGLLAGLIQAATSIQDQTMPLTLKLLTVILVSAMTAPLVFPSLVAQTSRLLDEFPALTR